MTVYNGSNGNDILVGDGAADTFNPLLGHDSVAGGGGLDILNVNYAALTAKGTYAYTQYIYARGVTYDGEFFSSDDSSAVTFSNIEKIVYKGDARDSSLSVQASSAVTGGSLNINGGGGFDHLGLDLSTFSGSTFTVGLGGSIASNRGVFAGFESFSITVGSGMNTVTTGAGSDYISNYVGGTNTYNTGSGNDYIRSTGGADSINGGLGIDNWSGYYGASAGDLIFSYDGSGGVGTQSNGTTLAGIETLNLVTGTGNDRLTLTNISRSVIIDGGAGTDALTIARTGLSGQFTFSEIHGNVSGGFDGRLNTDINGLFNDSAVFVFSNVEKVDISLGYDNDTLTVDAAPLATSGTGLFLNGGVGIDTLRIDFSTLTDTVFNLGANNVITGSRGTFAGFETFEIKLGDGLNSIEVGAGADVIYALNGGTNNISTGGGNDFMQTAGGVNAIDGGADFDVWYGDYHASSSNISVNYDSRSGTGAMSNGTTLAGIEQVIFFTGTGDDDVTLAGIISNARIEGGAGSDTLVMSNAGLTGTKSVSYVYGDGEGGDGFSGYLNGETGSFRGFEKIDLTLSDDDNSLILVTAPLAVLGTSLVLNGGIGSDTLQIDGTEENWTISEDGLGGYVLTYLIDSNRRLSITNFEHLEFRASGHTIELPSYGQGGTVIGTAGNDSLIGTDGNDFLKGLLGNDRYNGGLGIDTASFADATRSISVNLELAGPQITGEGQDTLISIENLIGSGFNDTIRGNAGANALYGGSGNDKLYGEAANDVLSGGDGADLLDGGTGGDMMFGGAGNDIYVVDDHGDEVVEGDPTSGVDTVKASVSFTLGVNLEKLTLTGFGLIDGTGNVLTNTLTGNDNDNVLRGLGGKDVLVGGAGNDTLNGGAGADIMTGGYGHDLFVFDNLTVSADKDTVKDFVSGQDRLAIDRGIFDALTSDPVGAMSPSRFALGVKAITSDQHLIYNNATGALYYDADGSGIEAQVQIALLTGHPSLSASDFFLI